MRLDRFSFRPGDPPRIVVRWRTDMLGRLREVAATLDGVQVEPEPRRPGDQRPWTFRMPDGRSLEVLRVSRMLGGEQIAVLVEGRELPGGFWGSGEMARRAGTLAGLVAVVEVSIAWAALGSPRVPTHAAVLLFAEPVVLLVSAALLWRARPRGADLAAVALALAVLRWPFFLWCVEVPVRAWLIWTFFAVEQALRRPPQGAAPPCVAAASP